MATLATTAGHLDAWAGGSPTAPTAEMTGVVNTRWVFFEVP
ncbi:hypothetical protein [Trichothermofontia sp.]